MKSTAELPVVGMDIAKNVFQLHIVDPDTGEIQRLKLKRDRVAPFFAERGRCLVAMEACGGAHHWARLLMALGHDVKLLPARQVRPFVLRHKTDARDAQAIWVAAQQAQILAVPIKSAHQQECLALHRMRAQLMKMRIMQTNALRGLLYEFGIVLPEGHRILMQRIHSELAVAHDSGAISDVLVQAVQEQILRICGLQADIDALERRITALGRSHEQMAAVQAIPGIGPLTATALIATATDVAQFSSAKQFAAWLGLTPRQTGTGGKTRQLGLSKRGDTYVRTLLMHGARAVIARRSPTSWIAKLLARRPYNVVVAALANKLARTAWAVLVRGQAFDALKWHPTSEPSPALTSPALASA
jgi:transposase